MPKPESEGYQTLEWYMSWDYPCPVCDGFDWVTKEDDTVECGACGMTEEKRSVRRL